jgi:hypothetical protein
MRISFKDLFWQVWEECGLAIPDVERFSDVCFAFELTTPYNRVVVKHAERRITFLSAFRDGKECEVDMSWPKVRSFPLGSFDDILASFKVIDPLCQEGYVVVDGLGNRNKIKHPGYIAIHHMRGEGMSPKRVIEIMCTGETTEVLATFPEWRPDFEDIQNRIDATVLRIETEYALIKHIENQKEFALQAVKMFCPPALFEMRKGYVTGAKKWLDKQITKNLLHLLRIKDVTKEDD